eukprot:SAG11_NODE_1620_length_4569_cov_2.059955_8_plen_36_part_00
MGRGDASGAGGYTDFEKALRDTVGDVPKMCERVEE